MDAEQLACTPEESGNSGKSPAAPIQEYGGSNGLRVVFAHYYDDNADELIDELIRIVFTQNMKSMEKYYRWLSRFYARTFKRLHKGLVNTIFRYNRRFEKSCYMATMAGTRKNVRLG